jgi:predicted AlkP superfamily pyrophosphatase or phosphodiesterase
LNSINFVFLRRVFQTSLFLLATTALLNSAEARKRLLVVGWDGARGDVVHHAAWVADRAPQLKKLMQSGVYAPCETPTDPRCARAHSGRHGDEGKKSATTFEWMTAPGWASVLTGLDSVEHGVANNKSSSLKAFTESTFNHGTFFMRAKNLGLKTAAGGVAAFLTSRYTESGSRVGYGVLDYECGVQPGTDKPIVKPQDTKSCNLDDRLSLYGEDNSRDQKLTDWLLRKISDSSFDVIMGVYDQVDGAGHSHGFSKNSKYLRAIEAADSQLGQLLQAIELRIKSHSSEEWLIVLTSDHGGHDTFYGGGHSETENEDEVIPFVMAQWGHTKMSITRTEAPVRQMETFHAVTNWLNTTHALTRAPASFVFTTSR